MKKGDGEGGKNWREDGNGRGGRVIKKLKESGKN